MRPRISTSGTRAGLLGALGAHGLPQRDPGCSEHRRMAEAVDPARRLTCGHAMCGALALPHPSPAPAVPRPPPRRVPVSQPPRSLQKTCLTLDILKFLYLETSRSFYFTMNEFPGAECDLWPWCYRRPRAGRRGVERGKEAWERGKRKLDHESQFF